MLVEPDVDVDVLWYVFLEPVQLLERENPFRNFPKGVQYGVSLPLVPLTASTKSMLKQSNALQRMALSRSLYREICTV